MENLKRIRHQLLKLLTRHGYIYRDGNHWTQRHLQWLRAIEFGRFDSPKALMSYLGLTPSEYSSGERRQSGSITKTGNSRVRRLLVESSWHYRHRPGIGKDLQSRRKGQPQWAIDIADRAMLRLHRRYRRLVERGKMPNKAVIAVAREFAGFIWAMMRQHQLQPKSQGLSPHAGIAQVENE